METALSASDIRANALRDFRVEVEALAGPVDHERVHYRRARCERAGHFLGRPEIQYRKHTRDTGRWFIVCRQQHPGDVQGSGTLFEYVSGPLSADDLLYLRNIKAATDASVADAISARRYAKGVRKQSSGTAVVRSIYELTTPMAPRQPPKMSKRARSPSLEIVEPASIIYLFHQKRAPPVTLQLPLDRQALTIRLSDYDSQLENYGVKLADSVHILVVSDEDGASPFWLYMRVCELSVPMACMPLVVSSQAALPSPSRVRRLYQHACDVRSTIFIAYNHSRALTHFSHQISPPDLTSSHPSL
ncbi:unnamed protein product [Peniophora sp. CBMAI 1063]|nr:unnamed protein product [Peniophora sp. CBMAI 1063]